MQAPLFSLVTAAVSFFLLAACGVSGPALHGVSASTDRIVPGSLGIGKPPGALEVRYSLGSDTQVTARLEGPVSAPLLTSPQRAGDHTLRFAGVITASESLDGYSLVRRVVPSGDYAISLSAGGASEKVSFRVDAPPSVLPRPANIVVRPEVISPNSDAVDDVAELTFRTEQTSTVSVDLSAPGGQRIPVFAPQEKGPGEQRVVVAGQDLEGKVLPNGNYTLTVQLQDRAGNRVQALRPFRIEGGGEPLIEVVKVEMSPPQIMLGGAITVSITVKNTGNVPLRTQGPDPGYTYTTNDSYASIEGGKFVDRAGLWRVGADWDANTGGGPFRYPFRWGFGKTLMPGETVTTGGRITVLKQEQKMWFYAGVLQEGIRIVLDKLGRTPVSISY